MTTQVASLEEETSSNTKGQNLHYQRSKLTNCRQAEGTFGNPAQPRSQRLKRVTAGISQSTPPS